MQITLEQVHKRYRGAEALRGVSLTFEPGKLVAILGLNGAGKTTLLKAMAGLTPINGGRILWDGYPLRRDNLDLRRRFLFLPDQPFLIPEASVLENIATYLTLYKVENPDISRICKDLVANFDLSEKGETPVSFLSRGQAYKTGVAALCAVNPDFWMLDEPFASGMDAHGIGLFRQQAEDAAQAGKAVIYTTQLVDLAVGFSDRVCILHQGQVHAYVPPGELKAMADGGDTIVRKLLGTRE